MAKGRTKAVGRQLGDAALPLTIRGSPRQLGTVAMANSSNNSMHVLAEAPAEKGAAGVHDRGLLMIAIFKLAKSLFFFGIGVGAIHFLHKDLGDAVLQLAKALRFDPESRAVSLVLDKVDLIGPLRLREIGIATFAYSALALTEGIGLLLERTWAEYLTLILTVSFVPWELVELFLHASWIRVGIFVLNLAVLWYLIWLLKRKGTLTRGRAG
jgi:uncharacterized membrane protein (DUF2068 family)